MASLVKIPRDQEWGVVWGEYLRRGQATPEVTHRAAIPFSFMTPLKIANPPNPLPHALPRDTRMQTFTHADDFLTWEELK